jgi:hypothetical protein
MVTAEKYKNYIKNFLILFLLINNIEEKTDKNQKNISAEDQVAWNVDTGFFRNDYSHVGADDHGTHVVCAVVTDDYWNLQNFMETIKAHPDIILRFWKQKIIGCPKGFKYERA